jgi:hypothetical protein
MGKRAGRLCAGEQTNRRIDESQSGNWEDGEANMQIVDPTNERAPIRRALAERPQQISGTVALLDISKPRGDVLIERLAARLGEMLPDVQLVRYRKPTYTKPAPEDLRKRIAEEASFIIEALAD